jgi:hypothetical protein
MNRSPTMAIIRGWVDLYTRGMPADVRAARRDELEDDLWCEHEEAVGLGRSPGSLAADLILRLIFGIPADISWRVSYRGRAATGNVEQTSAVDTRTFGVLAIVGGLIWGILFVLFVPFGDTVWTGRFGVLGVAGSLVAAIAFSAAALGLAWRFQDHVGPVGVVGAAVVTLGAAISLVGFIAVFAVGSVMLMLDLARIGILSRTVTLAHVAAAIAIVGAVVVHRFDVDETASRALMVGLVAPYVVTWIAIGASFGRVQQVRAASH